MKYTTGSITHCGVLQGASTASLSLGMYGDHCALYKYQVPVQECPTVLYTLNGIYVDSIHETEKKIKTSEYPRHLLQY
jgi:hypothetical protein